MKRWKKKLEQQAGTDQEGLYTTDDRVWNPLDNEDIVKIIIKKNIMMR